MSWIGYSSLCVLGQGDVKVYSSGSAILIAVGVSLSPFQR